MLADLEGGIEGMFCFFVAFNSFGPANSDEIQVSSQIVPRGPSVAEGT